MHWREAPARETGRLRVAVVGEPPDAELTLRAIAAALRLGEEPGEALLLDCDRDEFADCVAHLTANGFTGVAVGNPHKPVAAHLARQFFVVRYGLGVANALQLGEILYAQNTEVPAFKARIAHLSPGTALVLGSGRASRSAIMGLFELGWRVRLWNRNVQRSRTFPTLFERYGQVETVPQPDPSGCTLIVNATSLGRKAGEEPPLLWKHARPKTTVVDYVYRNVATDFLRKALQYGFKTVDGRELLVEQAALSVEWWTQRPVDRGPMLAAVGFRNPALSA